MKEVSTQTSFLIFQIMCLQGSFIFSLVKVGFFLFFYLRRTSEKMWNPNVTLSALNVLASVIKNIVCTFILYTYNELSCLMELLRWWNGLSGVETESLALCQGILYQLMIWDAHPHTHTHCCYWFKSFFFGWDGFLAPSHLRRLILK